MKRYWGAYGNKPDDTEPGSLQPGRAAGPAVPQSGALRRPVQRRVCCTSAIASTIASRCSARTERSSRRGSSRSETLASGSVWDLAFSRDPQQRYLFVVDGMNQRVHVVLRDTLEVVASFGDGGRQPGQFYGVHSIAIDSKGNLYTTETWEGKRLQKFVYRGHRHRAAAAPGRRVAEDVTRRRQGRYGPRQGRLLA